MGYSHGHLYHPTLKRQDSKSCYIEWYGTHLNVMREKNSVVECGIRISTPHPIYYSRGLYYHTTAFNEFMYLLMQQNHPTESMSHRWHKDQVKHCSQSREKIPRNISKDISKEKKSISETHRTTKTTHTIENTEHSWTVFWMKLNMNEEPQQNWQELKEAIERNDWRNFELVRRKFWTHISSIQGVSKE